MKDYLLDMHLMGYKIVGFGVKNIEAHARLREAKRRYINFSKSLDLSMLHEYFKLGMEVEIFIETQCTQCGMIGVVRDQPCFQCGCPTHFVRAKQEGEDLFFEFDWEGYNYKFRRQSLQPLQITNPIYNKLKDPTMMRRNFAEFKSNMNFKPIIDYFLLGLEAKAFTDSRTGKLLTKNDALFGADNASRNYLYTFMRQRVLLPEKPREKIKISPIKMEIHKKKKEYFDEGGHPIDKEGYDDIELEQIRKMKRSKYEND